MNNLIVHTHPDVAKKFKAYPKDIAEKMNKLRELVLETAAEQDHITELEETLKWGEPSYLVKKGSTIRMDWKEKNPDQYALYFKCTSKLVSTFIEVHGDTFQYEKTRAILFPLDAKVPVIELKSCIAAALNYHHVKTLPNLGITK